VLTANTHRRQQQQVREDLAAAALVSLPALAPSALQPSYEILRAFCAADAESAAADSLAPCRFCVAAALGAAAAARCAPEPNGAAVLAAAPFPAPAAMPEADSGAALASAPAARPDAPYAAVLGAAPGVAWCAAEPNRGAAFCSVLSPVPPARRDANGAAWLRSASSDVPAPMPDAPCAAVLGIAAPAARRDAGRAVFDARLSPSPAARPDTTPFALSGGANDCALTS